jgi:Protein of unknown function (DUF3224)
MMVIRGRLRSRLRKKRRSSFLISNLPAVAIGRNATALDLGRRFRTLTRRRTVNENTEIPVHKTHEKGATMAKHAIGTFAVKVLPQPAEQTVGDPTVGRLSIDKQFHGDLEATSKGQMLAVGTDVKGSAGYVAMERVAGTLHGRRGTFALQHSGTMTRGTPELKVTTVPDSGTGDLIGITGTMEIKIVDGQHLFDFEYTLPEAT